MLARGDLVPHFTATTIRGEQFSYSTIWQRKNLVLVALPTLDSEHATGYVSELTARNLEFSGNDAECVITRDPVPGFNAHGVLVADRWGEVVYAEGKSDVVDLPTVQELMDWLTYLQSKCPECDGESK